MESPSQWWRQCILATCRGRAERPKSPTGGLSSAPEFRPRPTVFVSIVGSPNCASSRSKRSSRSRTYPCPIRSYDHVLILNAIDLERKLEEYLNQQTLAAAVRIIPNIRSAETSNNIVQKGLAFECEESGSATIPGASNASKRFRNVDSVAHQPTDCGNFTQRVGRRDFVERRQVDQLDTPDSSTAVMQA